MSINIRRWSEVLTRGMVWHVMLFCASAMLCCCVNMGSRSLFAHEDLNDVQTAMSMPEFLETYLYVGMPESEFQTLLHALPPPVTFVRRRETDYELGWGSMTSEMRVYFYHGRLEEVEWRAQKGWLRYWEITGYPSKAKVARFTVAGAGDDIATLATQIDRLLRQLHYRPYYQSWSWSDEPTHVQRWSKYSGIQRSYCNSFAPEVLSGNTPPDPLLDLAIIPRVGESDIVEIRIFPSFPKPEPEGGTYYLDHGYHFPKRQVTDSQWPVVDFGPVDSFAERFSQIVNGVAEELPHVLGANQIHRVQ